MSQLSSYASGSSDQPLLGMTIGDKFDEIVASHGQRPALVSLHQGQRLSYSELGAAVATLAKALLAIGPLQTVAFSAGVKKPIDINLTPYCSIGTIKFLSPSFLMLGCSCSQLNMVGIEGP